MGRRSINSTKAGKYMNPTDQARKEARRRELKKNKKQRQQVRQAVIKQKDPKQILNEMEQLDKLEYDPNNPPPYNVKVLQDKRRKLKESLSKIQQFYQKEDPKLSAEIKSLEFEYERKRFQLVSFYESIMQAQRVKVDDIPLPSLTMPPPVPISEISQSDQLNDIDIPMPSESASTNPPSSNAVIQAPPKSILKTSKIAQPVSKLVGTQETSKLKPPGPPPGSPPSLSEFECDDDEFELGLSVDDAFKPQEKSKKIRFNDAAQTSDATASTSTKSVTTNIVPSQAPSVNAPLQPSLSPYLNRPPTNVPIISPASSHVLIAPPPPPVPPQYPIQTRNMQQIQTNPPRLSQNQPYYQQTRIETTSSSASGSITSHLTTIEAKPVLRNKVAEITKFVPTSLMVKRDAKKPTPTITLPSFPTQQQQGPYNYMLQQQQQYATLNPLNTVRSISSSSTSSTASASSNLSANQTTTQTTQISSILQSSNGPTARRIDPTDATYESFMKEIGKLL